MELAPNLTSPATLVEGVPSKTEKEEVEEVAPLLPRRSSLNRSRADSIHRREGNDTGTSFKGVESEMECFRRWDGRTECREAGLEQSSEILAPEKEWWKTCLGSALLRSPPEEKSRNRPDGGEPLLLDFFWGNALLRRGGNFRGCTSPTWGTPEEGVLEGGVSNTIFPRRGNEAERRLMGKSECGAPLAVGWREAVRITSLSRSTLYRHMKSGRLRGVKVGKCRRFLVSDLMKLLEEGRESDPYYPY